MRIKYIFLISLLAMGLIKSEVYAQSNFAGFYGQISTGYENNQLTNIQGSSLETPYDGKDVYSSSGGQSFGGAPLVLGFGYYWQVKSSWLIGVGADYSALTQTGPARQANVTNAPGGNLIPAGTSMATSGATTQLSNRYNIFISPGYLVDKDKLLYVKAGYSQVSEQEKRATSVTIKADGISKIIPTTTAGTSDNVTAGGYLIGAGYKQIIGNGLYAFGEVNYMGYGTLRQNYSSNGNSASKSGEGFSNSSTTNISTSQNLNSYQFLIGVGYLF